MSAELYELLSWYALNDPDPEKDRESVEGEYFDLLNNGLNSVRGGIASEMAHLIAGRAEHIPGLIVAIGRLANDPVAAVRAMAAEAIIAISAYDRPLAASLFQDLATHTDDRLFETHYVYEYLWWRAEKDFEKLKPIIERMIASPRPSVREHGAKLATGVALQRSDADELASMCLSSDDEPLRKGAATVYKANVYDSAFRERCSAALKLLFNDPSADVRETAGNAIWRMTGTQLGEHVELAQAFLTSAAFAKNANDIVHALKETTASLSALTLDTADKLLGALEKSTSGRLLYEAKDLMTLVLRAYVDTEDRTLRERALNLIDHALRLDVYGTNALLAEHDRSWAPAT